MVTSPTVTDYSARKRRINGAKPLCAMTLGRQQMGSNLSFSSLKVPYISILQKTGDISAIDNHNSQQS